MTNRASKKDAGSTTRTCVATREQWSLGKLVSLTMENFLTYQQCTVMFDPCLNVIMGPNGTGKSSIVCGICLALNGKATLLGRAKDDREYIAYGWDVAKLRIELYNPAGPAFTIERTINRTGSVKNKWIVNGETSTASHVDQLKLQLSIRIESLCQFLPQDRVQAFSAMSDSARLEDSINSIDPSLSEKHKQLKELANEGSDFEAWKKKTEELIDSFSGEIDILAPQVQQVKDKRDREERRSVLKQKKLFLLYEVELKEFNQLRERRDVLEKEVSVKREDMKPLQKVLCEKKDSAVQSMRKVKDCSKNLQNCLRSQEVVMQKAEQFSEAQQKVHHQLDQRKLDDEKRVVVAQQLREEIAIIQQNLTDTTKSEQSIATRTKELEAIIDGLNAELAPLENEHGRVGMDYQRKKSELEQLNKLLMNFEHKVKERENELNQFHSHSYRAYQWVKEHESELGLEGEWSLPMFLSLAVTDQSRRRQVEMHLKKKDLFAFVFANKQDLDKFSSIVNDQMGLVVDSLLAPSQDLTSDRLAREQLSRFNCDGVLLDFISAPGPVMRYLQKIYFFHKTPIGNQLTDQNIDELSQRFPVFYSNDRRFQSKKSKYSGQISSGEVQLRNCRFLKDTFELSQKMVIQQQRTEKLVEEQQIKKVLEEIFQKMNMISNKINQLKSEKSSLAHNEKQRKQLETSLQLKSNKLRSIESAKVNMKAEFEKATKNFQDSRQQKLALMANVKGKMEEVMKELQKASLCNLRVEIDNFGTRLCERQLKTEQESNSTLEGELQRLMETVTDKKRKARNCWVDALKEANLEVTAKTIPQYVEDKFQKFGVPDDVVSVEQQMEEEEEQLAIIALVQLDEGVVERFEKLNRKVEELRAQKDSRSRQHDTHQEKVDQLRYEWLQSVKHFIERLDRNFSRFMSEMQCSGRVELQSKGDLDPGSYGLSIKVSYRRGEGVQELKREYQSGGEKSVATMLYLLALQELTTDVPFRIVDEINQGMDADNERKVFNMIVETVCNGDSDTKTSQYLFVTPKLLLDLQYQPNMSVLVVNNGVANDIGSKDWNISKFIKKHRRLTAATQDGE